MKSKLLIATIAVLSLFSPTTWAQNPEATKDTFATAKVLESNIVPHQQVNLEFIFYTKDYFSDAPEFSLPTLDNALTIQESSSTSNGYTLIDGVKYTSQVLTVQIYPSKQGVYSIPNIDVTMFTGHEGKETARKYTIQSPVFVAKTPEEFIGKSDFLATSNLDIEEVWSKKKQDTPYKVGDIIKRTITVKADHNNRLTMPSFRFKQPEGVSLLISEPKLTQNKSRGEDYGQAVYVVTYSIDSPGQYTLGAEQWSWWNTTTHSVDSSTFESRKINAGGIPWKKITNIALYLGAALIIILVLGYIIKRSNSVLRQIPSLLSSNLGRSLNMLYNIIDAKQGTDKGLREAVSGKSEQHSADRLLESQFSSNSDQRPPSRIARFILGMRIKRS